MNITAKLTLDPVTGTLTRLAVPMLGGLFAVIGFNLADTYFVAKLGTRELAAMSFTFPVTMVLIGISFALGTGTTAVVSQAIGRGEQNAVRRLASDSIVLSFFVVLVCAAVGLATIEPLFTLLGAQADTLPLIVEYMTVWYLGIAFLVVPMVANSVLRATGDSRMPALIMMTATGLNVILDPILIFGWFGFPRMELEGAALATVIARSCTMAASLAVLHFRDRILNFRPPRLADVWTSWKLVGSIALPVSATNIMQPLGLGLVTRLVADYGPSAVAAWGAGSRISAFTLIPVYAVCSALVPFIGQNWGAGLFARVYEGRNKAYLFAAVWGVVAYGVVQLVNEQLAGIFSEEPQVVADILTYLRIIPVGFALVGMFSVNEETLNAIGQPVTATVMTIVQMFLLVVPFTYAGSHLLQYTGLLVGATAADIVAGLVGLWMVRWMCRRCQL
jgi:putative MATE family efflux protein